MWCGRWSDGRPLQERRCPPQAIQRLPQLIRCLSQQIRSALQPIPSPSQLIPSLPQLIPSLPQPIPRSSQLIRSVLQLIPCPPQLIRDLPQLIRRASQPIRVPPQVGGVGRVDRPVPVLAGCEPAFRDGEEGRVLPDHAPVFRSLKLRIQAQRSIILRTFGVALALDGDGRGGFGELSDFGVPRCL